MDTRTITIGTECNGMFYVIFFLPLSGDILYTIYRHTVWVPGKMSLILEVFLFKNCKNIPVAGRKSFICTLFRDVPEQNFYYTVISLFPFPKLRGGIVTLLTSFFYFFKKHCFYYIVTSLWFSLFCLFFSFAFIIKKN